MIFERNTAAVKSRAEITTIVMRSFETTCLLRLSAQKFLDLLRVDLFCKIQDQPELVEFAEGMHHALNQVILKEQCVCSITGPSTAFCMTRSGSCRCALPSGLR